MLSGQKLKFLRIRKKLTQKYIAEQTGVSIRWIKKIENNGAVPSEEVYKKWLNALYS